MSIISNSIFPPGIINIGGEYMTVFMIVVLIMSLLLVGTKYWNKYISNIFDISSNPLLLTFVAIVIFKIMITI